MPDSISIDSSDLSRLVADLGDVPQRSGRNLRTAIEVTARHVRDDTRTAASGSTSFPDFPRSITYDIEGAGSRGTGSQLTAEIGPDRQRGYPGNWGAILEYGSVNSAPRGYLHGALQRNEDDFERGIERAVDDSLKSLGL